MAGLADIVAKYNPEDDPKTIAAMDPMTLAKNYPNTFANHADEIKADMAKAPELQPGNTPVPSQADAAKAIAAAKANGAVGQLKAPDAVDKALATGGDPYEYYNSPDTSTTKEPPAWAGPGVDASGKPVWVGQPVATTPAPPKSNTSASSAVDAVSGATPTTPYTSLSSITPGDTSLPDDTQASAKSGFDVGKFKDFLQATGKGAGTVLGALAAGLQKTGQLATHAGGQTPYEEQQARAFQASEAQKNRDQQLKIMEQDQTYKVQLSDIDNKQKLGQIDADEAAREKQIAAQAAADRATFWNELGGRLQETALQKYGPTGPTVSQTLR